MNALSRRRFLGISAATLAAAGLAPAVTGQRRAAANPAPDQGDLQTIPTFCDICFWKCGAIATVRDGQLWKLEGNPADPLCRGRLCPRGSGGPGAHFDPDRLQRPLLRANVRGEDTWNVVSWDEALGYTAEKMQALRQKYGPESMALISHGIGGTFLKHLMKAYGTPNLAAPSFAQCRGPRDVGFRLTFGDDPGSPERTDIAHARCLVLIGSHLGENMHNTQVQEFASAIERDSHIIVVDPRFSTAASKAKHYLPIKPGTDLALILAWINVLVTEKLYDVDYVTQYTLGLEQLAAYIAPYTPEWAWPQTGIPAATIRETAQIMARNKPATLVHPGRHAVWYGDDAQRSRGIAILNALLGSWGRKGGFYTPAQMDLPGYPYPPYPHGERGKVDNPDKKYPFAHDTLTTGIREAAITGKPYPIKGLMTYATNLIYALPNETETIEAFRNLDLLAVVDVAPSETAGWADVVLPESTYLERYDELNVELFRDPFIALRQPVVASPHDQKPNWWIARELGLKLGLAEFFPWKDIEAYLDFRLKKGGYSLAELQKSGILVGPKQPIYFEEGVVPEFNTPSGKIELFSTALQKYSEEHGHPKGFEPLPHYTPPEPGPAGSYRLLCGRAPVHTFSRTQTNGLLADVMPENAVWLNAGEAKRLGLRSGDRVCLRNQDGTVSEPVALRATERIRPDCVYMVHGFGHTAKGLKRALRKGASDSRLQTRYAVDPLMGGTALNVNFVSIEPAGAAGSAAV
jgi:thiosulfate reductase/polysulfide reductase chain A